MADLAVGSTDVEATVRQLGTLRSIVDDTTFASLVRDSVGDHPGSDIISLVERFGKELSASHDGSPDDGSGATPPEPPDDDLARRTPSAHTDPDRAAGSGHEGGTRAPLKHILPRRAGCGRTPACTSYCGSRKRPHSDELHWHTTTDWPPDLANVQLRIRTLRNAST